MGVIVLHAHKITYVHTNASVILLMHRKIFGRINWLPLKRKPEDLVEEKIYVLLNIYIFFCMVKTVNMISTLSINI